ncbi:MAG: GNAT family N-acetyltransferase [Erysipelotrichales bacterium]|nr:GNAT family N-acetyltransferase [Erysipelotrichales bacterium]
MINYKYNDNVIDWYYVREEVFIKEQGFMNEFDDLDNISYHITMYEDDYLIGCGRYYKDEDYYVLGRIAILKPYRGNGYSKVLISEIEHQIKLLGGNKIKLHAQCRAMPVYNKLGYREYGEIEYDEHVEHIWMRKEF